MNKQTNALLTILCLCVVSSFLSGCSFFEETICSEKEGQTRNGLVYLPNQEEPFTGKNICKYENGQKANEGSFKDGEKDGKWTRWYENGQKQSEGNYKDGEIDGKWTRWYENGHLQSERIWSQQVIGKGIVKYFIRDGLWIEGYENGGTKKVAHYIDGKKDGEWIEWYANGFVKQLRNYKYGNLDGKWVDFSSDGQVKREINYKDGKEID